MESIRKQARAAAEELLTVNRAHLNPIKLMVIGCSSSEIVGGIIGHASSSEAGEAVANELIAFGREHGIEMAFQCCEHLNRALVVERDTMEKRALTQVCVVPQPKAGGALATAAYRALREPVVVESISADAGLDIGRTLIGMHLRAVAVPARLANDKVGAAEIIAARTRPKLIGGERAKY